MEWTQDTVQIRKNIILKNVESWLNSASTEDLYVTILLMKAVGVEVFQHHSRGAQQLARLNLLLGPGGKG